MSNSNLSDRLLDDDIQYLIRSKARQLIGRAGFRRSDLADLEQELRLRLFQRLRAYDPAKASFYCFALVVIDRAAKTLLRSQRAACRDRSTTISFDSVWIPSDDGPIPMADSIGSREHDARLGRHASPDSAEAAIDFERVLGRLTPELRDLAEGLKSDTRAKLVRRFAIPDYAMKTRLRLLREHLTSAGLDIYRNR